MILATCCDFWAARGPAEGLGLLLFGVAALTGLTALAVYLIRKASR